VIPDIEYIKKTVMKYSLKITGSTWDAEDLAQDVIIKLMIAFQKNPGRQLTNAFLYRIAINSWKDKQKKKNQVSRFIDYNESLGKISEELSTREMLEVVSVILSPRSVIILLLMDVFDFTAKETAKLLAASEGAIQVAIGRIRSKLKLLSTISRDGSSQSIKAEASINQFVELDTLVDAFRRRDMQAICNTYFGLARQGTIVQRMELEGEILYFTITDPDGNRYRISSKIFS
jgi:RNA polymerase sigma factor (sigma-70 family)